jgi:hypothetical protein
MNRFYFQCVFYSIENLYSIRKSEVNKKLAQHGNAELIISENFFFGRC